MSRQPNVGTGRLRRTGIRPSPASSSHGQLPGMMHCSAEDAHDDHPGLPRRVMSSLVDRTNIAGLPIGGETSGTLPGWRRRSTVVRVGVGRYRGQKTETGMPSRRRTPTTSQSSMRYGTVHVHDTASHSRAALSPRCQARRTGDVLVRMVNNNAGTVAASQASAVGLTGLKCGGRHQTSPPVRCRSRLSSSMQTIWSGAGAPAGGRDVLLEKRGLQPHEAEQSLPGYAQTCRLRFRSEHWPTRPGAGERAGGKARKFRGVNVQPKMRRVSSNRRSIVTGRTTRFVPPAALQTNLR